MCGIVGYVGWRDAVPVLLEGLGRLENGGPDTAGLAVHTGRMVVTRGQRGRVRHLVDLMERLPVHGSCGIAHTLPDTTGDGERNANPRVDCQGRVAVVLAGRIDNAAALRDDLRAAGHRLESEGDTETLAHLIEAAPGEALETRLAVALDQVEGSYAVAAVWAAEADKIAAASRGAPLLLGIGDGEMFVASEQASLLAYAPSLVALGAEALVGLTPQSYRVMRRVGTGRVGPARRRSRAAQIAEPTIPSYQDIR